VRENDARKAYRARYYDPSVGRFLSEDPIGFGGGGNFYAYVENRPTILVDPSGRIHQLWNEPPFDGRLHDDAGGGLEVLCTNPRTKARDIGWLEHSITVRSAELALLGNKADAGHIAREAAEAATLKRCKDSCDDDKKPVEEPLIDWESVKESVKKHKKAIVVVGTVVVVVAAVALAPETGGGSLVVVAAF
jgi:hypothetical protein